MLLTPGPEKRYPEEPLEEIVHPNAADATDSKPLLPKIRVLPSVVENPLCRYNSAFIVNVLDETEDVNPFPPAIVTVLSLAAAV